MAYKRSKSTKGHNLNNLSSACLPNATDFKALGQFVREKIFLNFFYHNNIGQASMLIKWPRPFERLFIPGGCTLNLVTLGPVVFEENLFETVE